MEKTLTSMKKTLTSLALLAVTLAPLPALAVSGASDEEIAFGNALMHARKECGYDNHSCINRHLAVAEQAYREKQRRWRGPTGNERHIIKSTNHVPANADIDWQGVRCTIGTVQLSFQEQAICRARYW